MAAYLLDTSAVVKRYIQQIGTGCVRGIADPATAHLIYLVRITDVELTSAVVRRQRGGTISAQEAASTLLQFRQDLVLGTASSKSPPACYRSPGYSRNGMACAPTTLCNSPPPSS